MEIRFSPSEEDLLAVMRVSPTSGWNIFQFIMSFASLFFIGVAMVNVDMPVGGWFCIALSLAIALAGYEVPRFEWRKLARTAPSAKGQRVLIIDNEGIAATFPMGKAQYEWRGFTRYRETAALFVLFISPRQVGSWIPKRVMSSEQIEELRTLLKVRLPIC